MTPLVFLLGLGHFTVDFYMGFFQPLLPHLSRLYGLNLTKAGALVSAASSASSLTQPVFGALTDRVASPWLLPIGVLLTTTLINMIGRANGYLTLLFLAIGSGIGSAIYHPFGAAVAARLAEDKKGSAVSVYSAFGSLGASVAPLVAVFILMRWGLDGLMVASSFGMLVAIWLAVSQKKLRLASYGGYPVPEPGISGTTGANTRACPDEVRETSTSASCDDDPSGLRPGKAHSPRLSGVVLPLLSVISMLFLRSWVQYSFMTFLPFWFEGKGLGEEAYGFALFLFLLSGTVGGLTCGALADRGDRIKVLVVSGIISAVSLALCLKTRGVFSFVFLALAGAGLNGALPISVVLAQEILPKNTGLASGMTLGFTWGLSGLATIITGRIGDLYGIETALWLMVPILILSVPAAAFIPSELRTTREVKVRAEV